MTLATGIIIGAVGLFIFLMLLGAVEEREVVDRNTGATLGTTTLDPDMVPVDGLLVRCTDKETGEVTYGTIYYREGGSS